MNTIFSKFLGALVMVLILFSCTKDPFDDIQLEDRQFLTFSVPGQIGPALIKASTFKNTGTIQVFVVETAGDLTQAKPDFVISEGASVSPALNEVVNLKNTQPILYTVISQSGKERIWEIIVTPYESSIEGEWKMKNNILYDWHIGINETWGWGVFGPFDAATGSYDPNQYVPATLSADIPNAALEDDNLLSFTTVEINENGNPEGTFTFDAGADGQFAPFIVDPDRFGGSTNYAYRFRRIPEGTGVWEFNEAGQLLSLWKGNKSGTRYDGTVTKDIDGNIRISFDVWISEFTWDHFDAESHLQNASTLYYDFSPKN